MDEVKRRRQSGAELQQAFLDFLASQGLEPPRAELQQAFLELVASHGLGETKAELQQAFLDFAAGRLYPDFHLVGADRIPALVYSPYGCNPYGEGRTRARRRRDGDWLDSMRSYYRGNEGVADKHYGERLVRLGTAGRIAALEEGIELLHEGLDRQAEALIELEREIAKSAPNKARLHVLRLTAGGGPHDFHLTAMRRAWRRWTARGKAADKRALAPWHSVLNAASARLNDLWEQYLLIERRVDPEELEAAYDKAFDEYLQSVGAAADCDDELFDQYTKSFKWTMNCSG